MLFIITRVLYVGYVTIICHVSHDVCAWILLSHLFMLALKPICFFFLNLLPFRTDSQRIFDLESYLTLLAQFVLYTAQVG